MTQSEIKNIIKECILEIFKESEYLDDYRRIIEDVKREFQRGDAKQSWKLISSKNLIKMLSIYVKYHRINEQDVDKIWQIVKENCIKIFINSDISLHNDPEFFDKEDDSEITDEEWKRFAEFASDNSPSGYLTRTDAEGFLAAGHIRMTDQSKKLYELLRKGYSAANDEELLIAIDQILNFTHGIGYMADWFVEGGVSTLDRIRDMKIKGIII